VTPEAKALARTLLSHHRQVCRSNAGSPPSIDRCLVTYGALCERAGVPHLTHTVGHFLEEVARWCEERGWPPINSLAVNRETRMPGEGYDQAPGCSLLGWPAQLEKCIAFDGYPESV
jgi:hypothetical protein